jgi:hypothetical protein
LSGNVFSDRGVWDYQQVHVVASGDAADDISFSETLAGVTVHDPGVAIAGVVDDRWVPTVGSAASSLCSDELGTRTCANAPMVCTSGFGAATCSTSRENTAAVPDLVSMVAEGGAGDDRITIPVIRSAVTNYAYGGAGDDALDATYVIGGSGADTLRGFALYEDAAAGISASDDGIANDGEPGEHDNILAGTGVSATPFADHITLSGDASAYANGGDDVVATENGQAGGGQGADTIRVTGSGAAIGDDSSIGGGDDTIDVRNGVRNLVQCGPGQDTVLADALDDTTYYRDCEHVTVG